MKTAVVTDSTCDLPEEVTEENDIHVIPLYVHFGEKEFKDGIDLTSDEFYNNIISSDMLPRTSQPSVGDFVKLYEKLADDYDNIISLHISSLMSGTYESACLAAERIDNCNVIPVDTQTVSLGLGFLALKAARLCKDDYPAEVVENIIKEDRKKLTIYFTVGDLKYLKENGRIGKAGALLGSILNINPILQVKDGEVHPYQKVRGSRKTFARMKKLLVEKLENSDVLYTGTLTGGSEQEKYSDKLNKKMEEFEDVEIVNSRVGPVVGSHSGPQVYGVAILNR